MEKEYYYNEHDINQVDKLYKKKKKKKLKRKVKILCFILLLILIGAYFVSDLSKVKNITVIGNNDVDSKLIEEASTINKDSIYLLINKDKVEENIKSLPLIKKAEVSFDVFGNVTIEIEESKKVAYCVIDKITYVLDENGKVLETKDKELIESLKAYPQLLKFETVEFLETFAKEYAKVPDLIRTQTSDIIYSPEAADETRVEFVLDNGKTLIVRVEDMADKLSRFPYEAHMITYSNKCEFNFLGKYIYIKECKNEEDTTNTTEGDIDEDNTNPVEGNVGEGVTEE